MSEVNALIFTDCSDTHFVRAAGAYRIATELRKYGYSVQVIDHFTFLTLEQILILVRKYVGQSTLIVGISSTFMGVNPMKEMRKEGADSSSIYTGIPLEENEIAEFVSCIKTCNPSTKIVMGGARASYITDKEVDIYFHGYAENMILSYMEELRGIGNVPKRKTKKGNYIVDYDEKGSSFNFRDSIIDWHDDDYLNEGEALPIEISRGCIFRCKFCSFPLNGRPHDDDTYVKYAETLYAELMQNYERYGTTQYIFCDDTYNDSVKKVSKLLQDVFRRLPFNLRFFAYLRHDLIYKHREMADILLESGLACANFGIETLNWKSGQAVGKGLHPEKTVELLHWLREKWGNKVNIASGFIIGLPYDTKENVETWLPRILDEGFPLDRINLNPLGISRDEGAKTFRSEFDRNAQNYGYKFLDPTKPDHWTLKDLSYAEADLMATEAMTKIIASGRNKVGSYMPFGLKNLGYDFEKVIHIPDRNFRHIEKLRKPLVSKYYDKIAS